MGGEGERKRSFGGWERKGGRADESTKDETARRRLPADSYHQRVISQTKTTWVFN